MSFHVNRNIGPCTTGAQSVFALKQWLCTSHPGTKHWTVVASGDGLAAYSATGDVISHSGSGANGLDNANAWFVLRDPDSNRWFLFHRVSYHYQWNFWYQLSAFVLTGCGASTPPSAPNNPNRKTWMPARSAGPYNVFPSSGSWYLHICCEGDTPEGNVYPFWAIGRYTGAGTAACALLLDCVIDATSPAADGDKAVLLSFSPLEAGSGAYLGYSSSYSSLCGFMRYGEANEEWSWFAMPTYTDASYNYYPGAVPVNPEDGKLPIFPAFVWRKGGTTDGVKGQLKMMCYKPSTALAAFGDTMYDGTDYYLVVDHVMLRGWPDSTAPSV